MVEETGVRGSKIEERVESAKTEKFDEEIDNEKQVLVETPPKESTMELARSWRKAHPSFWPGNMRTLAGDEDEQLVEDEEDEEERTKENDRVFLCLWSLRSSL